MVWTGSGGFCALRSRTTQSARVDFAVIRCTVGGPRAGCCVVVLANGERAMPVCQGGTKKFCFSCGQNNAVSRTQTNAAKEDGIDRNVWVWVQGKGVVEWWNVSVVLSVQLWWFGGRWISALVRLNVSRLQARMQERAKLDRSAITPQQTAYISVYCPPGTSWNHPSTTVSSSTCCRIILSDPTKAHSRCTT